MSAEANAPPSRLKSWVLYLFLAVSVCAVDLWSKAWVWDYLHVSAEGHPPRIDRATTRVVHLVPGFFDLEANYNYGAFNGWFSQHTDGLAILSAVALLVITGIVFAALRRSKRPSAWFLAAMGLIAGGTAGNLYDRAVDAAVRDWIKWFVVVDGKEWVWPNFNIADSGICVGVGILVVLEIRGAIRDKRAARESAATEEKASATGR